MCNMLYLSMHLYISISLSIYKYISVYICTLFCIGCNSSYIHTHGQYTHRHWRTTWMPQTCKAVLTHKDAGKKHLGTAILPLLHARTDKMIDVYTTHTNTYTINNVYPPSTSMCTHVHRHTWHVHL